MHKLYKFIRKDVLIMRRKFNRNSRYDRPVRSSYRFESVSRRNSGTGYLRLSESLYKPDICIYANNKLVYKGSAMLNATRKFLRQFVAQNPEYLDLFVNYLWDVGEIDDKRFLPNEYDGSDDEVIIKILSNYIRYCYSDREDDEDFDLDMQYKGLNVQIYIPEN